MWIMTISNYSLEFSATFTRVSFVAKMWDNQRQMAIHMSSHKQLRSSSISFPSNPLVTVYDTTYSQRFVCVCLCINVSVCAGVILLFFLFCCGHVARIAFEYSGMRSYRVFVSFDVRCPWDAAQIDGCVRDYLWVACVCVCPVHVQYDCCWGA